MNVKLWVTALGLLIANAFIWFSIAPAFEKTTDLLDENLLPGLPEGPARDVFIKIVSRGKADFQLLIIVGNIAVILWAFMTHQRQERYTGRYF